MANLRTIRRRIKSVQNIAKITQAMEMIAALKMKRAQERGVAGRPYAEKITQVIADLAAIAHPSDSLHPLLQHRPVKNSVVVHITPDRGLCGGMVGNVNRKIGNFILEQRDYYDLWGDIFNNIPRFGKMYRRFIIKKFG